MSPEIRRGTPLEKLPEPELGTDIIPAERYTSPEFMAREWDKMWTRTWQVAGPTSDVSEVGSYFTFEIGTESILVVRSAKDRIDAFNEVYHVQGLHPELLDFTDDVDCPIDLLGRHSRFLFYVLRPSPRWTDERARAAGYRDRNEIPHSVREIMQSMGVDPDSFEGDMRQVRPALIARLRELGNLGGLDFEAMNDEQLWIDVHYSIFPNITLNISAGHFWYFRHRPHETDPNRMYWDFQEYKRIPRNGERPPRPEHIDAVWGDGNEQKLHLALRQDGDAAPPLQRGMRSRGFKGLHLAHQERRIRHFHATLDTYLEA